LDAARSDRPRPGANRSRHQFAFHFDHVGGNALIPNATMLVQRREWDAGMNPDTASRHARLRSRPQAPAPRRRARRVRRRLGRLLASLDRLAALGEAGARIFFGHDPEFWRSVRQAPYRF